jgi:hypothetical protein
MLAGGNRQAESRARLRPEFDNPDPADRWLYSMINVSIAEQIPVLGRQKKKQWPSQRL